jgi:hypothetical protein
MKNKKANQRVDNWRKLILCFIKSSVNNRRNKVKKTKRLYK